MNEKIRNRIIGGIVLVCLLIIVVPLLNAPSEEGEEAAMRPLPLPPSLQAPAEEGAVSSDGRRRRIDARFKDWENFLREEAPQEEARGAKRAADTCRVRVGVFAQPDAIVQRLRDDGRQVRLQNWGQNAEGGELFAVYTGGTMQCGDAERLQESLQARYGVRSLIEYNNGPP